MFSKVWGRTVITLSPGFQGLANCRKQDDIENHSSRNGEKFPAFKLKSKFKKGDKREIDICIKQGDQEVKKREEGRRSEE